MKCKAVSKEKMILYYNNELSHIQSEKVKMHMENCEECLHLYSNLELTYNLTNEKEFVEPNPFLYTRINQRLVDIKYNENQTILQALYPKLLQTVLFSFVVIIGLLGGIMLGSIDKNQVYEQSLTSPTTEFYFNDLEQEQMEALLIND